MSESLQAKQLFGQLLLRRSAVQAVPGRVSIFEMMLPEMLLPQMVLPWHAQVDVVHAMMQLQSETDSGIPQYLFPGPLVNALRTRVIPPDHRWMQVEL